MPAVPISLSPVRATRLRSSDGIPNPCSPSLRRAAGSQTKCNTLRPRVVSASWRWIEKRNESEVRETMSQHEKHKTASRKERGKDEARAGGFRERECGAEGAEIGCWSEGEESLAAPARSRWVPVFTGMTREGYKPIWLTYNRYCHIVAVAMRHSNDRRSRDRRQFRH
jgi:hypothetical protein